jgi:hypothetical protein
MDPKFQSSFIPKASLNQAGKPQKKKRGSVGVFSIIATILFLTSLALSGGVYLYVKLTESGIERKAALLEEERRNFNPELISELSRLNKKIIAAGELAEQHIAPSAIFEALEETTLRSIRFTEMDFKYGTDRHTITMRGEARNFASIALQSDLFGKHRAINEPIFSNLNLTENGNVSFVFSAVINRNSILYQNNMTSAN